MHVKFQPENTPPHIGTIHLGFAAYLLFMRGAAQAGTYAGQANGRSYAIEDERAAYFADLWARLRPDELTTNALRNTTLWGHDLTRLPHFAECVSFYLHQLLEEGASATLTDFFAKKTAPAN